MLGNTFLEVQSGGAAFSTQLYYTDMICGIYIVFSLGFAWIDLLVTEV